MVLFFNLVPFFLSRRLEGVSPLSHPEGPSVQRIATFGNRKVSFNPFCPERKNRIRIVEYNNNGNNSFHFYKQLFQIFPQYSVGIPSRMDRKKLALLQLSSRYLLKLGFP